MALGFFRRRKADDEQPSEMTVIAETQPVETPAAREQPDGESRPQRPRRGGSSGQRGESSRGGRSRARTSEEGGGSQAAEPRAEGSRRGTGTRRGGRRPRPEPSPGEARVELSAEHFEPLKLSATEAAADGEERPDMSRSRTRRGTRGGRGRGRGRRSDSPAAEPALEEAPLDETTPAVAEIMGWTAEDEVGGPPAIEAGPEEAVPAVAVEPVYAPPPAPAKPQPPRFEFGRRTPVSPEGEDGEAKEEPSVTEPSMTAEQAEAPAPETVEAGTLLETPPTAEEQAQPAAEPEAVSSSAEEPAEDPKPRGRRGGRRTTKAKEEPAAEEAAPVALEPGNGAAPAPVISPDGFRRLEELVSRQTDALQAMQAQLGQTIANVDRSLAQLRDSLRQQPGERTARLGVFVDVANIELEARKLESTLDWGKVLDFLGHGRWLVSAVAYAPITDDREVSIEANPFVHPFLDKGFRIVSKEIKRLPGGDIKANFDVELAIDVLSMAERLDVVCLITGDGDFTYLVERLQARGIRVEVAAFPRNTSRSLRLAADAFYDIRTCARGSR